ncbi:MAG TPA: winged helix-turn-helix domain-containing protein [Vicinamibacterales bacterium]|nr:winged helix-turn-helix domain-containing protein [Vicinamibacterales bacterium]
MTMVASYRFGPFTVDASSYRLLRGAEVIPLSPKIIDLLLYLVARQSALVGKDELFSALWPDVAVTDNALTQAVSELRQALGDDPSKPTYIQTVARRGYRFIATVEPLAAPQSTSSQVHAPATEPAPPAIAVLDFTNVSTDKEFAWLASGIAETVTNDLRAAGTHRIIDRVRVVEAVRRVGTDLANLRKDLHLDLAVVGSFQRSADRLRITARVVDAGSGEALAEAKADGKLEQVFELQDRIVEQFGETLGKDHAEPSTGRRAYRETSSLEAYQAFTEGRVRLESLDASLVSGAIADFERAIVLDPRYALAHVGLANARFWQYEMSRARSQPDAALLARAIDHVRRAIELERTLAEAHATLAFLLVSAGRFSEALAAARRAVALEPGYWGNQFRLAHAEWGEDRLRSLAKAMELYPDFPFAHFEIAMVYIARGDLERAESVLREGTIVQDRQANLKQRYPAKGLHWLLGLVRLARGDQREAREEFDREVAVGANQLYAAEFNMNAFDGAGFAALASRNASEAVAMFNRALELFPEHARSLVGLAAALTTSGDSDGARMAFQHAAQAIEALRRGGRTREATMAEAFMHVVQGRSDEAILALKRLVEKPELPFSGWTAPIEPLFEPLRERPDFRDILVMLARNAQ